MQCTSSCLRCHTDNILLQLYEWHSGIDLLASPCILLVHLEEEREIVVELHKSLVKGNKIVVWDEVW